MSSLQLCLKNLCVSRLSKVMIFKKIVCFFNLKIYVLGVWSKACKCLARKRFDQVA